MLDYHGHGEAAGLAAAADGWSRPRLRQIGGCGEAERGQPAPTPTRIVTNKVLIYCLALYQPTSQFPYHPFIDLIRSNAQTKLINPFSQVQIIGSF